MTGQVTQGRDITADVAETCDVCIIGSGAGGGVLAAGLVARGLNVVMLEAGGYHTRRDFDLHEQTAFPALYQGRGGRSTTDLAISILQGRAVGGSTTVNWTTCFRTPDRILKHWQQHHGIEGLDPQSLAPHFEAIEERLNIATWPEERANANNRKLLEGARALGWEAAPLRRNVKGCVNSGFCGMGCPVDGKQGQHVTTIPDAIAGGMRLYSDVEVRQLVHDGKKVAEVRGVVMERGRDRDTAHTVTVRPKVVALCGGAINNPVLLLRSELNPNGRVGLRTFLHPVVSMAGIYEEKVDPYYGAPQSIGSHQFIDRGTDKVGYFLEAAPMHPMLTASAAGVFASELGDLLQQLPHISGLLALQVDGLLPGDDGGTTTLRPDGRPGLHYPVRPALVESMRHSHRTLARLHLAAGAREVGSLHANPIRVRSEADLDLLDAAPYGALQHAIFSAHQMGGCAMGPDPSTSVVGTDHRHHSVHNLYIVDGSVLPTALGVNPSQTIYGLAHRARDFVASAV